MKQFVVFFILISLSFAENVTPENMYPENASGSFATRPPNSINHSTTTRTNVTKENGSVRVSPAHAVTIDTTKMNMFGKTEVTSDVNWTNALSLEKLFKDRTQGYLDKVNGLTSDLKKKAANKFKDKNGNPVDDKNPETFSKEAVVKNFEEESDTRSALAFQKELYDDMRAKLVVDGQIKCYITRKVNNSYYCPLPGMGTAEFGGLSKDNQEEAQTKCNLSCRHQVQCMEARTSDTAGFSKNGSHPLPIQWQTYRMNPNQITKELSFEYVTKNLNAVQERYFKGDLVRGRITIKGTDPYGNEMTILDGYTYHIKRDGGRVVLKIDKRLKELKLYFFSSFIFDPRRMDEVALYGDNPEVIVKNISAGYRSNKRYFCPIKQFSADSGNCDGKMVFVNFGGTSHSVCVPSDDKLPSSRSAVDGGFFRKDSCLASCWDEAECVPTYRHLSLDPNNLPSDMYDLEYGCVADEGGDNKGCTKERCRAMFEKDTQPSKEVVWEKDDKKVITVDSGVAVDGESRPRVDFQGELGAVGQSDKTNLFTEEMKDTAYRNMIKEESFNVSKQALSKAIPSKVAVDVKVNTASRQISFNILYKANSFLYDTGRRVYLYPVIEVFSTYAPFKPIYHNGMTYYPENDKKIKAKDSVLLIQDQSTKQWVPFNRKMWQQYYLPSQTPSGQIVYKWFDTPAKLRQESDVFSPRSKKFVVYGAGYKVPSMGIPYAPKSTAPWENFSLFPSLSNVINVEGIFMTDNNVRDGKVYDFSKMNKERKGYYDGYKVYLVSSVGSPLDLLSVARKVGEETLIYDSKSVTSAKTTIEPDSAYADERVKLYLEGRPGKQSVFMKMKPNSLELEHKGVVFMFLHK